MTTSTVRPRRRSGIVVALGAVAMASWTAGCDLFSDGVWEQRRDVLERNRERWADAAVRSYRHTVLKKCACTAESYGLARVTVSDGAITRVEPVYRADPVPEEDLFAFDTVEALFSLIAGAIEAQARYFEIEYDSALGYPTLIDLDFTRRGVSDKFFIEVTNFEVTEPE